VAGKLSTFVIKGLLTLALLGGSAAHAASPEQVQAAIDRAREFLYAQRNRQGTWETAAAAVASKTAYDVEGGQWGGLTSLAAYSLLAAGDNPRDARLSPAISFLLTADIRGIYALGLRAQIWMYLPRQPLLRPAIMRDGRLLLGALKTNPATTGMYGYLVPPSPTDANHPWDHSVSQYGVLGMWALQEAGLEVPDQYWATVDSAWRRDQLAGGAWSYYARPQQAYPPTVTLTAAGVASLFITDDYLRSAAGLECRDNLADTDIERGLDFIRDHFDTLFDPPNRPCYALYGIERIGAASGRRSFGGENWYDKGADFLISHQNAGTGAWDQGDGPVADTALGLLFLVRGRAPVVMNKLDYSASSGWDRRPRDLAHLTNWISKTIEARRPLNWQTVDLAGDPDDWHEAPILYVCGRDALRLSVAEQAKLKQFAEDGGLILFNTDCPGTDNSAFTDSVRALGRRLFDTDFRLLPPDHPIYANEEFHRDRWPQPPQVLGLGNGVRELMILIPNADLSAAWQVNSPLVRPEAFQLATDIFLYAVDKENLRVKGDSYLARIDPAAAAAQTIKIARLNYGPGWDPEPGGWRRLTALMHNRDGVDLAITPVALGDGSLLTGGYAVAHLTGTSALALSDAARRQIKAFVENGGTLIVDAAGGSHDFAQSARGQLSEIFGGSAAQLDTPLQIEHPFYAAGDQKIRGRDIQYRPYARTVLSDMKQPRLRAIAFGPRLGVYFSAEDISAGLVGEPVDGIVGYQPELATRLMERMILTPPQTR
jgi:hypothetical protein